MVALAIALAMLLGACGSGDESATRSRETEPRTSSNDCRLDTSAAEDVTGFDEVIESTDCVYWVGPILPGENAESQCAGVLSDLRAMDPDVLWVKIKDSSGTTQADCR